MEGPVGKRFIDLWKREVLPQKEGDITLTNKLVYALGGNYELLPNHELIFNLRFDTHKK